MHAELTFQSEEPEPLIHPELYGHFVEHLGHGVYGGIWVGEGSPIANTHGIRDDVVSALRELNVPVIRWPGGCFADEYRWRRGVGPRELRPRAINHHWGGVIENHHFGTHEFMELCSMLDAKPYVCANVGSGSVQEMMDWVEYMTCDADTQLALLRRENGRREPWTLPYLGIGNESWGCGGNMRAEYYADSYRRYASYVRRYGGEPVQRVACGPSGADYEWTDVLLKRAGEHIDALSLHWYTVPTGNWQAKGSATEFDESGWHATLRQALRVEELILGHTRILDGYDPGRRIGLVVDEWGTWYDAVPGQPPHLLQQENTLRDALVAAVTLNTFNRHCDRVRMANIAQLVNVLQALLVTEEGVLVLTPTYHVFEMYKVHQGAARVSLNLETPAYELGSVSLPMVHASASRSAAGAVQLSLVNLHAELPVRLLVPGFEAEVGGRVLTAPDIRASNSPHAPGRVRPVPFTGASTNAQGSSLELPPRSVSVLTLRSLRGRVSR